MDEQVFRVTNGYGCHPASEDDPLSDAHEFAVGAHRVNDSKISWLPNQGDEPCLGCVLDYEGDIVLGGYERARCRHADQIISYAMARQALQPITVEEEQKQIEAFRQAAALLKPWHKDYAAILANPLRAKAGIRSYRNRKIKWFRECMGFDATEQEMDELEQSGAFIAYYETLRNRDERALRHRIVPLAHKGLDNLEWAMDHARKEKDVKSMAGLVNPILERAIPRRDANVQTAVSVNITLSERRMEALDAEPVEVNYEVIQDPDDT